MKIQRIEYLNNNNISNNHSKTFKGFVNGNYYKDEIIELAKKYRYSSTWKDDLRKNKETIEHAIANWHDDVVWGAGDGEYNKTNRVFLGCFTLGLSEVLMGASSGISAAIKNKKIESMISEIAKCIDDLRHSY